jgi:hypothetical protein
MRDHGISNWWAQTLTVDYEQARGLRKAGDSRGGRGHATSKLCRSASLWFKRHRDEEPSGREMARGHERNT